MNELEEVEDEIFDAAKFLEASYLLSRVVSDLDIFLFNCAVSRQKGIALPTHHIKTFFSLIRVGYEHDFEEYIHKWQNRIVVLEADSSAIAEFEYPCLSSENPIDGVAVGIHPTAHGYAAALFLLVTDFLTQGIWDKEWEEIIPEVAKRLQQICFIDQYTLARVSARLIREQSMLAFDADYGLSPERSNKSISIRIEEQEKRELLLSVLANHHQLDGNWNDIPITGKQVMAQGGFGSPPSVSRAFGALFGKEKKNRYLRMIRTKTLAPFLERERGETQQGFLSFDDSKFKDSLIEEDTHLEDDS